MLSNAGTNYGHIAPHSRICFPAQVGTMQERYVRTWLSGQCNRQLKPFTIHAHQRTRIRDFCVTVESLMIPLFHGGGINKRHLQTELE